EVTTPNLKFLDGAFDVRYTFNGPLTNFIDSVNKVTIGDLYGSAVFRNTDFNSITSGYEFRDVDGNINFKKPDLWIESLSMRMNGNKMTMTGSTKYFIAFLLIPGVKAYATLDLTADTIDFNAFQQPPSARKEQKEVATESKKADIPDLVNWISTSVELNMNVSAKKVIVNRFSGTAIKANLVLANNSLQVNEAAMNTSGGNFLLNLSIDNLSGSQHALNAKTTIKDVSMSDLLYSFNNFNQSTITDQNISGTLSTNASFAATIDQNYQVIGSSMKGSVRTRVKNGQLKNVDGLDKVSNYIFKNRDFNNIDFADIDNRSRLEGTVFDIDTLNIFSSVLTLFITGIYDFNKTTTDMLITVPLINLKKMDATERLALTDSAAKKGGSLVLRATHSNDGDLKVMPVILGKDKKKEEEPKPTKK
ncbi:MAG: AsmA-like C-terminal region-containing protein, partial [Chitinophagales bacterium]